MNLPPLCECARGFFSSARTRCTYFCVHNNGVVFRWFLLYTIHEYVRAPQRYEHTVQHFYCLCQYKWIEITETDWDVCALGSFQVSNPINSLLFFQMNFCCPLSFPFPFSFEWIKCSGIKISTDFSILFAQNAENKKQHISFGKMSGILLKLESCIVCA